MTNEEKVPAITIYTKAYNVENYIRECAESVLNQSFNDFEWLVLDNGCTDKTGEILEEYAKKDSRIKFFKNFENDILYNKSSNPDLIKYVESLKSEYWCILDSDDYLHTDFFKELHTAAKEHDADIAVGGTEMFQENNPQLRGSRCPPDFYTENISSLGDMLPQIYGSFRPMWGKLIKTSIAKRQWKYRRDYPLALKNGGDTIFCLDCLNFSTSVVGVNKVLHYYRIRQDSLYNSQLDKFRYLDYKIIYEESKKLLVKWDKLSDNNLSFISIVLYASMKDCLGIAANAVSVPIGNRLEVIETILADKFIYEIFMHAGLINNLFVDTQSIMNSIIKSLEKIDLPIATTHYIYRFYRSLEMINSPQANRQNAFLLYISSMCDYTNPNRLGSTLLYSYFSLIGKQNIAEFEKYGVRSEFLTSDPLLLRELTNNNFDNGIKICEEHPDNIEYMLLEKVLKRVNKESNPEWIDKALVLIEKHISAGNIGSIVDLLLKVLDWCPLDKKALCYKLYLLASNNDVITALETAEILRILYSDDSEVLALAAQAYKLAGLKDKTREVLEKALDICTNETKKKEIKRELEII